MSRIAINSAQHNAELPARVVAAVKDEGGWLSPARAASRALAAVKLGWRWAGSGCLNQPQHTNVFPVGPALIVIEYLCDGYHRPASGIYR